MITVIGIAGYTGRMGQAIAEVIKSNPQSCLAGGVSRCADDCSDINEASPLLHTKDPDLLFPACDVIIEFTHATATADLARAAAKHGKPFMCGTTGLSPETQALLKEISATIPVLYASNTSLSLIVIKQVVELAARLLKNQDYDISILDRHHKWKKDAPSGTALTIGASVLKGNGGSPEPTYAAIRGGSIVGEHEILFAGQGEYINVHHTVTDRRVFARGAVEAAIWLAQQKNGFYTMDDVLTV